MLIANGIEAVDVTLIGGPPIDRLLVEVPSGLTVLYGPNGSGKSTVLRGIRAALSGVTRAEGESILHCRVVEAFSGYDSSLLARLAALTRFAAAGGEMYVPSPPYEPDDPWEQSIDLLEYQPTREFPEFWSEGEFAHETVVSRLREDIAALGAANGAGGGAAPMEVMLPSAGSRDCPAWEVSLGAVLDATNWPSDLAENLGTSEVATVRDLASIARSRVPTGLIRTLSLGRIEGSYFTSCLEPEDDVDVDALTTADLRAWCGESGFVEWADSQDYAPSDHLEYRRNQLSTEASNWLTKFTQFRGRIEFALNHPNFWPHRGLGQWEAIESNGTRVRLSRLGSAHRRWAALAAQIVLRPNRVAGIPVLFIDEPENALHPAAQRHLANGLTFDAPATVVGTQILAVGDAEIPGAFIATHSPALLSAVRARLLHVSRDSQGRVIVDEIQSSTHVDGLIAGTDLSRADVLTMTRTFVLVEGDHDRAVFETVLGDELQERRARLHVMGGAKQVSGTANAEMLVRYTDAAIVIVVDRAGETVTTLWAEALRADSVDDATSAEALLRQIERQPGPEAGWLAKAGRVALRRGTLARVRVLGLERDDIIEYLPVADFVPSASSWAELHEEHVRLGADLPFKQWLRATHGAVINTPRIRNAASRLDDLADLPTLLEFLS